MDRIGAVDDARGLAAGVVDAPFAQHRLEAGVAERVEVAPVVAELVEVQHELRLALESFQDRADEARLHHRVGVADDADLAAREHDAGVVHEVLVVVALLRHLEQQPGIDLGLEPADRVGLARVVLDDDHLEPVARHVLALEVVQQVEALAHAPVEQDERDLRARAPALAQQPRHCRAACCGSSCSP